MLILPLTWWRGLALLLLLGLTSCRVLSPPVTDREAGLPLPEHYAAPVVPGAVIPPPAWWAVFQSEQLNEWIALAVRENPSLEQAAARLDQAAAVARQARARRRPELSASAEASASRRRTPSGPQPATVSTESYSLGLAAGYELDLWGRLRAAADGARRAADASREDLATAAMTLVGQVADRWLQWVEAELQIRLVEQQIETNQQSLELLRMRTVRAGTPLLDFYQQEQVLRASEALLPAERLRAERLRNELALLTGQPAGRLTAAPAARTLPELPPFPRTGLPAELLMQRPDIRARWLRIEAAASYVSAARADRLPALRLTGNAAYQSESLGSLFDDWLANLAAGLVGPLLDGGRRRAEVDRTRAVLDERVAEYRQTVLQALLEVDNAIRGEQRLTEQLTARRRQLENARHTLAESQRRYLKGAITYLPVLTARRALEQLQRSELTTHRELLANRVALYRALGGDWTTEMANRAHPEADPLAERKQ